MQVVLLRRNITVKEWHYPSKYLVLILHQKIWWDTSWHLFFIWLEEVTMSFQRNLYSKISKYINKQTFPLLSFVGCQNFPRPHCFVFFTCYSFFWMTTEKWVDRQWYMWSVRQRLVLGRQALRFKENFAVLSARLDQWPCHRAMMTFVQGYSYCLKLA